MEDIKDTEDEPVEFSDDQDKEYEGWLQVFPDGFVLNTNKQENQKYTRLHGAECWTINSEGRENWTNHGHKKICHKKKSKLIDWCKERNFELDKYCQICKP